MDRDKRSNTEIWMPSAEKSTLQIRAKLLASIRDFFYQRNVLEVDPPLLASTSVTDINIESITAQVNSSEVYLQTSPEYFMKRLLAAGMGDIYSMGKVFRSGEIGQRHNPEFTLLEWYRLGWDEHQLMSEVSDLICFLYKNFKQTALAINHCSYTECFRHVFDIDPHSCALEDLQDLAIKVGSKSWRNETRASCLDLLFSQSVESTLPKGLVFVYDYPICQAALAETKINENGQWVSRRFETFLNGLELANGYFELTDGKELVKRFEADNKARSLMQKKTMPLDEKFSLAMQEGMPNCVGVALGIDRLLMILCDTDSIEKVMPFSWDHC